MSWFLPDNGHMELKELIAKNLKSLRDSHGLSQTAFAKHCKVQQRSYGRLENAESWQHLELIDHIAKACDLYAWQLLTPNFNPKNPPILKEASEKERQFYESIKLAAKELSKYEKQ